MGVVRVEREVGLRSWKVPSGSGWIGLLCLSQASWDQALFCHLPVCVLWAWLQFGASTSYDLAVLGIMSRAPTRKT